MLFSGKVKGSYDALHFPVTDLRLQVNQGGFAYPDLPKKATDVFLDLQVRNEGGEVDGTIVEIPAFRARLGNDPIQLSFYLDKPGSDPYVRLDVSGKLDLGSWSAFIPLDNSHELYGKLDADIHFDGRVSDAMNKHFERLQARGSLEGRDWKYSGPMLPLAATVEHFRFDLFPSHIILNDLSAQAGRSDIRMEGKIEDYLPWFFEKKVLRTQIQLASKNMDLDEWATEQPEVKADTESDTLQAITIQIPASLDASLEVVIGHLIYDGFEAENLVGTVRIRDGEAFLSPFKMDALGGRLAVEGSYRSGDEGTMPKVDMRVKMEQIDVSETVQSFPTVRALAPISQRCSGIFGAEIRLAGLLKQGLTPELSTLNGLFHFQTDKLTVEQAELVRQIGARIGSDYFDSPTLSKVDAMIAFTDGQLEVKPFETRIGEAKLRIGGNQGLDGELDYRIGFDVPSKILRMDSTQVVRDLFKLSQSAGLKLAWPERIRFEALVTGMLKKPVISLQVKDQLKSAGGQILEQVTDRAKEEVDKARRAAIEQAERQAAELLKQAETQGSRWIEEAEQHATRLTAEANVQIETLKSEARRQADELIKKAGDNPIKKLAAQEAGNRLKKEADKQGEELKKGAARQANQLIEAARKQKDQLMDQAKKEGDALIDRAKQGSEL